MARLLKDLRRADIDDSKGNTKTWSSSGTAGFKGSRRSTNYAAQATADNVARTAIQLGIKSVEVRIKGLGSYDVSRRVWAMEKSLVFITWSAVRWAYDHQD